MQYHRDAATRAQAFILTYHNPEQKIQHHESQQARENYEGIFQVLSVIIKAILYCGRQNIALRGHRDDWTSTSSNKGNFIELLKLFGEFDEGLRIHLESGRKNAMYTLKTVQNQVIAIIADMIREEVTTHIKGDNASSL